MSLSVATHSGPFHADDVLAVALLRVFVDEEATVLRTRDLERIAQADVVVDVGGLYDPAARRFDHHQASYTGSFSSAGMRAKKSSGRLSIWFLCSSRILSAGRPSSTLANSSVADSRSSWKCSIHLFCAELAPAM